MKESPSFNELKLMVGLELHQQLETGRKLFCSCPVQKSENFEKEIVRMLRPTQSELGYVDPAAIFEFLKGKVNVYRWNKETSCLVEADEEPPHLPDEKAIDTAILIGLTLNSEIVDEIHVMRKIVIDGSNTSGFQRTAVIGLGGYFKFNGNSIGVQSITLEEDAARFLGEDEKARYFALDRLGVPLVEVSLEPISAEPDKIQEVALTLGRILRSTGKVSRGLGTIRQDLNISIEGGGIVEVKGVQKLDLISKILQYEMKRQHGLMLIAEEIKKRGINQIEVSSFEADRKMISLMPEILKKEIGSGSSLFCIVAKGLFGLVGFEPYKGVRLGKELAEVARANSVGGVIHSDEFDRIGIVNRKEIFDAINAKQEDAVILLVCSETKAEQVLRSITTRIKQAPFGPPAETRGPTEKGETRYMRPRPGAQRMYPETDIPDIVVTKEKIEGLSKLVPEPWEKVIESISNKYSIQRSTSVRLFDEEKIDIFVEIMKNTSLEGPYVASVLLDMQRWLSREGIDVSKIKPETVKEALIMIDRKMIPKESLPDILVQIGTGKARSLRESVDMLGIKMLSIHEIERIIERKLEDNKEILEKRGTEAFQALMGEIMKELRGKASGEVVAKILKAKLRRE